VSFDPSVKVRAYPPYRGDTSTVYYTKHELNGFKRGAKALCLLVEDLPHIRRSDALLPLWRDAAGAPGDVASTESFRGLELRLFGARPRHRRLAQQALLQYQALLASRPGTTRDHRRLALAVASAKIGAWPAAVAAETARRDALRVRDGEYAIAVDVRSVAGTTALPFLFEKLRQQREQTIAGSNDESQLLKRRKKG